MHSVKSAISVSASLWPSTTSHEPVLTTASALKNALAGCDGKSQGGQRLCDRYGERSLQTDGFGTAIGGGFHLSPTADF